MRHSASHRGQGIAAPSRRAVLAGLGAAAPLALAGRAAAQPAPGASASAAKLPVAATFIEHLGTVVPDVRAATAFHSKLFNPAIMTERNPTPLRCYVDLSPGYLAFGSRPDEPRAFFDHYCVLLEDYDQEALAATLAAEGFPQSPAFTLFPDPDGVGVQLYRHPGGWFPTVVPMEPMVEGPALVTPRGLEHVMLAVADVDASVAFYRRFFGPLDEPDGDTTWIRFPDTRLGLRRVAEGAEPGIDHICIRVAPFDAGGVTGELGRMGVTEVAITDTGALNVTDPMGLKLQLKTV
jgi:hypothetical protein